MTNIIKVYSFLLAFFVFFALAKSVENRKPEEKTSGELAVRWELDNKTISAQPTTTTNERELKLKREKRQYPYYYDNYPPIIIPVPLFGLGGFGGYYGGRGFGGRGFGGRGFGGGGFGGGGFGGFGGRGIGGFGGRGIGGFGGGGIGGFGGRGGRG